MKDSQLKVVDVFCGAGGLSTGFKQAGFNIILGMDFDKNALQTYKHNHPETIVVNDDITTVKEKDLKNLVGYNNVDMVIGGPPCQGFSLAGRRDPKDPRNSLFMDFLRIVEILNPKIFVMENVPGLLSMKTSNGQSVFEIIESESQKRGYKIKRYLLNAAEYGVPQKRKRIFLIGSKNGEINLLLSKKSKIRGVNTILIEKEKIPKTYFYSEKMIRGFKRREKINKKLGRGFGWRFLDPSEPSYTISARYGKDGAEALIKYSDKEIRKLTEEECALIQSFPRKYKFLGSKSSKYRQIGNAVPPKLAFNVAKAIKQAIEI